MNRMILFLLAFGAFLVGSAELVINGVLNIIAADLHISFSMAGQFITAFSLSFAIGSPILITLLGRTSPKKTLIGSLILFIVGCLVTFFSSHFTTILLARVLLGLSAGVFSVVSVNAVAKLVKKEKMGTAIASIAFGFSTAMVLGVPLGVMIAQWWGWKYIFFLLGGISTLILLTLVYLLPETEGEQPIPIKRRFSTLKQPIITIALIGSLFICISNSVMLTYQTPYLINILHIKNENIGIIVFILGIFGMIGSRLGGFVIDRWGTNFALIFSLIVNGIALAILPLFSSLTMMGGILLIIWICTIFMNGPAIQSYFIQQSPKTADLIISLHLSVVHLGTSIGASVGGFVVAKTATVQYNPWVAAVSVLFSILFSLISISLQKKKSINFVS